MVSDKFLYSRTRIILFSLNILIFTGLGIEVAHKNYLTAFILTLSGLIIIYLLIKFYDATNETITLFFNSLRNDDTTIHFPETIKNKTLIDLYKGINMLTKHFQEIKIRNEYNESYYKTLIQHASTGILVLDGNNKIELMNKSACVYAGISPESTNLNLLRIKNPAFYEAVRDIVPGENVTYKSLIYNNMQMLSFLSAYSSGIAGENIRSLLYN